MYQASPRPPPPPRLDWARLSHLPRIQWVFYGPQSCSFLALPTQAVSVPEVLYEAVVEVDERLVLRHEGCQLFQDHALQPVSGGCSILGWYAAWAHLCF